jgi:hypothetical protein
MQKYYGLIMLPVQHTKPIEHWCNENKVAASLAYPDDSKTSSTGSMFECFKNDTTLPKAQHQLPKPAYNK